MVSLLHVFVVVPLAARNLFSSSLNSDRTFGWDKEVGTTIAVACGYVLAPLFIQEVPRISETLYELVFYTDISSGMS